MDNKLWRVEYSYYQSMFAECVHPNHYYNVIAATEKEALVKADVIFAKISKYHQELLETGFADDRGRDPDGYGQLSDLEKQVMENSTKEIPLSPPKLNDQDANDFTIETVVTYENDKIVLNYIPTKL